MNEKILERAAGALERTALVLAAMLSDRLGSIGQGEKAERLSRLGFTNSQIADALGTTENSINVSRVKRRRVANGKAKKTSKKKSKK
jgi:hypothetical protein